ncbi:MAG: NUDIX hydrolase [Rhodospirillaceae bacterium]|nr:NUDIX hydrolase [Rhodospirillaceae bacterium]
MAESPADRAPPRPVNFVRRVPAGDDRLRLVCADCGFIDYQNPRIVVGSVCASAGRILMCRRAINPRQGYWTLPAGFLEAHETATDGAVREAWEEARARIAIEHLLAVYDVPRISQVQLIYRARLLSEDVSPGPESQEVRLFGWDEIPWEDLAFPSVAWAVGHYREAVETGNGAARTNPPGQTGDFELSPDGRIRWPGSGIPPI